MTDRIDLDELDVDGEAEEESNPGDWFWRDEGGPAAAGSTRSDDDGADSAGAGADADGSDADVDADGADAGAGGADGADADADADGADAGAAGVDGADADVDADGADAGAEGADGAGDGGGPVPHVPRKNLGKPAGIPIESGGAGSGAGSSDADDSIDSAGAPTDSADGGTGSTAASGPHGGGVDEMTMALTYGAARRLSDPRAAVADARGWADWIGLVGDVEAFVLNKFQRDESLDLDFFNGSGTAPGERLAGIDRHSMFYAERMVVVGLAGEDEGIAEAAGWEFVPLSEAASKAGWEVSDPRG